MKPCPECGASADCRMTLAGFFVVTCSQCYDGAPMHSESGDHGQLVAVGSTRKLAAEEWDELVDLKE